MNLEEMANTIDRVLGVRVTGGRNTPGAIRFNVDGEIQTDRLERLSAELKCNVETRRGADGSLAVVVHRRRVETVSLSELQRETRPEPMSAVIGITTDGVPLLVRLSDEYVRSIIVDSAAADVAANVLLSLRYSTSLLRIIGVGEAMPQVPIPILACGEAEKFDDAWLNSGGVYCLGLGQSFLPHWSMRVKRLNDRICLAETEYESHKFYPASPPISL